MRNINEIIVDRTKEIINMIEEVYPGISIRKYSVSKDFFEDEYILRGLVNVDKVDIGFYFLLFVGASEPQFSYMLNNEIKPKFKKKTDRIIKKAKKEGKK